MPERTPLAMLPGLLCDEALWQQQVSDLREVADCRVASFTTQDSIETMARDVLAKMPEHFALAGLSMGGYVAMEIMALAPERVTHLALLDTKARPDSPEQIKNRHGMIELAQKGRFKGVTERLLPAFLHEDHLNNKTITETVFAMADRVGRDAFVRQQRAILGRRDFRPVLSGVRCPAVVIYGKQDALTPRECHLEIAAGIADAKLIEIDKCGHLSPLESPLEVSAALRAWLVYRP